MKRRYSNFLIVSFIGVLALGVYSYFHNDVKSASASDSSLTSSLNGSSTSSSTGTDKISQDISFINQLNSLTNLKIDTSLFTNNAFNSLVNNNIQLQAVPYGRTNPFAPVGTDTTSSTSSSSSPIQTKDATSVSSSSAVLNGSLEGATSSNVYFQYGKTKSLGISTSKVKLSLLGSFAITLVNLKSGTTYYFRSVASVGGSLVYGDIMSFKTN